MLGVKNIRKPAVGKEAIAIRMALKRAIAGRLSKSEKAAEKRFANARSKYAVEWK